MALAPRFKEQLASAIRSAGPTRRVRVIPTGSEKFSHGDAFEAGWLAYWILCVEQPREQREALAQQRDIERARRLARARRQRSAVRRRARVASQMAAEFQAAVGGRIDIAAAGRFFRRNCSASMAAAVVAEIRRA